MHPVSISLRLLRIGLLYALLLPAAAQGQSSSTLRDSVRAVLSRYLQNSGGISAAVINTDGEVIAAANGFASIGVPADSSLRFGIADLSQHLMAVMTLKLVENGTTALTSSLGSGVVTGSAAVFPPATTIEQMLRHTSGINSFAASPNYFNPATSFLFADLTFDFRTVNYTPVLGTYVAPQGAASGAGTFKYSPTNYLVLGEKLESIQTASLQQLLETLILTPAGLDNISFYTPPQSFATTSAFYFNLSGLGPEQLSDQTSVLTSTGASGSMVATPSALVRYLRALLGGQIIDQTSLGLLTGFQSVTGRRSNAYGLGTERFELTVNGRPETYIGHYGDLNYKALMLYSPEDSIGVAILSNLQSQTADAIFSLAQELLTQVAVYNLQVGIGDLPEAPSRLRVFPNPAQSGTSFVRFEQQRAGVSPWTLRDLAGRTVRSGAPMLAAGVQEIEIPLQQLPAGAYLLSVTADGQTGTATLIVP
ncbi:MAG: serine hydrolase [Bacteroidia bacterium]|nr:serine hydrolase [Bacteroidia bacterium]